VFCYTRPEGLPGTNIIADWPLISYEENDV
jgi:hypothetical protein